MTPENENVWKAFWCGTWSGEGSPAELLEVCAVLPSMAGLGIPALCSGHPCRKPLRSTFPSPLLTFSSLLLAIAQAQTMLRMAGPSLDPGSAKIPVRGPWLSPGKSVHLRFAV